MMHSINFTEQVEQQVRGVAQKTLNLGELQEIKIFIPPLSLQEEFAGVVARVESLRGRMGESTRQVEGLFESLLAQSFDGGQ
jgi:type I restriction enzyme S subunit